ncbi:CarD family transcriptional regulator [Candidatus Bealeia paramacronuclearis]|uniref:CarD family transcriptional regulator n=1 Tax=Candidatus Bealeia paramacronuclearis TaxID=1921001 RepID=A0ABZ2C207_9PROT|nr:CarD family transcriptional regulator [Candidatus Bealeia paramacronuclearis]
MPEKIKFSAGDYVVYPAHGVGKLMSIETQEISGHKLEVFVIHFEKDRMTLRLPVAKAKAAGLRGISASKDMSSAINALKTKGRIRKTMWSRRAQEYEAKINSGNPVNLAEVIRELHRTATQPEQSYSERQVYMSALNRLVSELAAVEKIDFDKAAEKVEKILEAA